MLRYVFVLLVLLIGCAPAPAKPVSFPRTLRDARGVSMTLRAAPRRIVSLAPGTTEMLFALGLGARVIGDTVYCDYPPAARAKTKVGDVNISSERVLALQPDLIVASDANKGAVTRLTQLHQPVFAIAPTSFIGVEQSLRLLGQATGTERQAQAVVAQMERKRQAASALAAHDVRRPRVLIVVGVSPLWTAGTGTFMDDIVVRAGGTNVAAGVPQYAPYSKEAVLAHPPDVILAGVGEAAALRADPLLRSLPAVRAGRFITASDPNTLTRPGPRLADALLQVARALHPGAK